MKRTEVILVLFLHIALAEDFISCDSVLGFREDYPRFPGNPGDIAHSPTEQLVPSLSPHNLKIESEVKDANLIRLEKHLKFDFIFMWDGPAKLH